MGKYEVTQKEWYDIMGTTIQRQRDIAKYPEALKGSGDAYPMYYVNWLDAVEYCNIRSLQEGLTPAYQVIYNNAFCIWDANGYRLPTEAEWEYAARGGSRDPMAYEYSGSNSLNLVAWYLGNSRDGAKPVGTKAPNNFGLYDMSGNVWEWCWDLYGNYQSGAQVDPIGVSSRSFRVLRGGSWLNDAQFLRSAYRVYIAPALRLSGIGFRVVRPLV